MSEWEWLRADWLEVASQAILFVILFVGGPWIAHWLMKADEQPKKGLLRPRAYTRRSRRTVRKQTPSRSI